MIDAKATIREVLIADSQMRDLVVNRKAFLKAGDMTGEQKMPALTFRDGPLVNLGERLWQKDVYVRVYDEPANGTINIDKIGRRMAELLHLQELKLQDGVPVKCKLMSTLGELEDPAFNKTFVQYQFRVLAL